MHSSVPVKASLNLNQASDSMESSAQGCSGKISQTSAVKPSGDPAGSGQGVLPPCVPCLLGAAAEPAEGVEGT